jgi:hypothetical protein
MARKKKKKTLTDAEIAQAVADAADAVERGGRSSDIRIGDSRFILKDDSLVQRPLRPLRAQKCQWM